MEFLRVEASKVSRLNHDWKKIEKFDLSELGDGAGV